MKKIIAFVFYFFVLWGLGCNGNPTPAPTNTKNNVSAASSETKDKSPAPKTQNLRVEVESKSPEGETGVLRTLVLWNNETRIVLSDNTPDGDVPNDGPVYAWCIFPSKKYVAFNSLEKYGWGHSALGVYDVAQNIFKYYKDVPDASQMFISSDEMILYLSISDHECSNLTYFDLATLKMGTNYLQGDGELMPNGNIKFTVCSVGEEEEDGKVIILDKYLNPVNKPEAETSSRNRVRTSRVRIKPTRFRFRPTSPNYNNVSTASRLYPFTSTKYLTEADLKNYSKADLRIMRNEIFATKGYIFQAEDLQAYFGAKSWYRPQYKNVDNLLSEIEKYNINVIKRAEDLAK